MTINFPTKFLLALLLIVPGSVIACTELNKLPEQYSNSYQSEAKKFKKKSVFKDDHSGVCIRRLTHHDKEPPVGFARADYSRRQLFNSDNSKVVVYSHNGFWHLYDANSLKYLKQLKGPASDAEIQWHPTNPNILFFMDTFGGLKFYELDVRVNRPIVASRFHNRLPWKDAKRLWTRSEGSPSKDGRIWAFLAETSDFKPIGIVVWDRMADRVLSHLDLRKLNAPRPDHLSMAPSGKFVVASWDARDWGTIAYSQDFKKQFKVHHKSEHSDIALNDKGEDIYVSVDYQSVKGDIFMVNLKTKEKTVLAQAYVEGTGTALHFSGKAYDKPGWVLMSSYGSSKDKPKKWLHDKLFMMELKENPRIIEIARHNSKPAGYWTEPHATVNRDFTKVLFNSNWNNDSKMDIDTYLIELKAN